jgi:hypothetical protein
MALYKEYEKLPKKDAKGAQEGRKALVQLNCIDQNMTIEDGESQGTEKIKLTESADKGPHDDHPVVLKGEELKKLIEGYVKQALKKELKSLCNRFETIVDASL